MRGFLFLMTLFLGLSSYSQKLDSLQKVDVLNNINSLKSDFENMKVVDSCDKYLLGEECGWFKDELFIIKMNCLYRKGKGLYRFEKRFRGDSNIYKKIADSNLTIIDSLILNQNKACRNCTIDYNRMRYEYNSGFDNDMPELINGKNKYHKTKEFISVSPQYFYGNNQWFGLEFSLGLFKRKTKMTYLESRPMYSFDYLSIGFRGNISNSKGGGMNLSLYSVSYNWINLNMINFSYLNNGENDSWGYAPEIGFQFWYLHLNAGYNLAFKKSMRSYEQLYFTAKFDIPFYRYQED